MKLAWKIFCMAYLTVMLTVGLGGFVLVNFTSTSMMNTKIEKVLTSNEYAAKMFLALAEKSTSVIPRTKEIEGQIAKISDDEHTDKLTICTLEETALYNSSAFVNELPASRQGYTLIQVDNSQTLQAVCRVDFSGKRYYIETLSDFTDVITQRDQLTGIYRLTILSAALLSGTALLCFSLYIAHPLKRLSQVSNQIAAGDYSKRIEIKKEGMGGEEIRTLSNDFNTMADAVENNIAELKEEIEKRKTFVADFTHELKTPMTSIIGYADMLRSYDLSEDERREAADAVYREGRRLERLSMQLLDILVLKNSSITLSPISSEVFFNSLEASLRFLSEKYGVTVNMQAEPALVYAEPVLLPSLLYNLADNACKASPAGETVIISGKNSGGYYTITVSDNGCGISKENLNKIMEPFYMEDKSRSRKQGGAGLGLALCKQIAELHGTSLLFKSEAGCGTAVTFKLKTEKGDCTKQDKEALTL